jgi:hypothetical protein
MAKQLGLFKFTGQMGGISFYEMEGEYYARLKTAHNVGVDPRFDKTYRTGLDFGTASRASKLLRDALGHTVKPFVDPRYAGRLTARFVKTVAADNVHECGRRQVSSGDLSFLEGFEFNKHTALQASLASSPTVSIDRVAGEVKIALLPSSTLAAASAQLVFSIVCINFKNGTYTSHHHTAPLDGGDVNGEFTVHAPLDADPETAIIVTLGVAHTSHGQPYVMAIVTALPAEAGLQHRREASPAKVPITRNARKTHRAGALAPASNRAKPSFHIPLRKSISGSDPGRHPCFQIFPKARENPVHAR